MRHLRTSLNRESCSQDNVEDELQASQPPYSSFMKLLIYFLSIYVVMQMYLFGSAYPILYIQAAADLTFGGEGEPRANPGGLLSVRPPNI